MLLDGNPSRDGFTLKAAEAITARVMARAEAAAEEADRVEAHEAIESAAAEVRLRAARAEAKEAAAVAERAIAEAETARVEEETEMASIVAAALWAKTLSLPRTQLSRLYRARAYTDGTMQVHQFCLLLDQLGIDVGQRKAAHDLFASLDRHGEGRIRQVADRSKSRIHRLPVARLTTRPPPSD